MKKILAVLLAILTVFSCTALFASAEDVTEPEDPPIAEREPVRYDFCEDTDFINVVYLEKGNAAATVMLPGDIITTYKTSDIKIKYYPDVDGQYKGNWTPQAPNNLAFSLSGTEAYVETFKARVTKEAIVRGINDPDFPMDFTIAYSDENVFLGWVVLSFDSATNTVTLCGLWDKAHNPPQPDETNDLYYIINFFYSIREKISSSVFGAIKWLSNAILFVKTWLYNLIFGEKAA